MVKETRQRTCLITKEVHPSHKLIRFVCDPDGNVIPDIAAKLPGRGCWILAEFDVINLAIKKKALLQFGHKVMSGKNVKVSDELLHQIEQLLKKRCLDYIGLANKAGSIIAGFEKVRGALENKKSQLLFTASDGAENGRNKMCQGLENLRVIDMFSREELSLATGLGNAVHLALLPGGIANSLLREVNRYERCNKTVIN